ncbi:acylneuraminate cytidylyltransferase family protein [Azospirillum argentinense]|uniref:Cytidylyltransferase domain-containing protein n=1 Tax=Azospirillum argentinense TaxID=2970906 RepID=A0A5B0KPZ2_9PROT|nr:acylneuraminate cytidylyltransferase family protein [Azospirillum argentinense]KAA1053965.1 Legionaminic acid cytidylyltransferase [Azospirillum argentinense]
MAILCVIGARGGSTGLRNKNIRPLLGKPLIAWSIEQAQQTPGIDRIVVSTDNDDIAAVARRCGADVPFRRPAELATTTAAKFPVWQHALAEAECFYGKAFDTVVDLDCTCPLRDVADISGAIERLRQRREDGVDMVMGVADALRNPYFNILEAGENGFLRPSKPLPSAVVCRQDAPRVFTHAGNLYVMTADYLRRSQGLLDGHVEGYDVGSGKAFDIDDELGFAVVEFLMRRKLGVGATADTGEVRTDG